VKVIFFKKKESNFSKKKLGESSWSVTAFMILTRNAGGVAACGQWQAFHFF